MVIMECGSGILAEIAPGIRMQELSDFESMSLDHITVEVGSVEHEIIHRLTDEIVYVLEGQLQAVINGNSFDLKSGSCVLIKRGTKHKFSNIGSCPAKILAVCSPPYNPNDVELVTHD